MRVIAGQWRGRRLQAPPGQAVRPTTDRVKEALFNILGQAVRDAVVIDLCCGAGGLAIEALSRGARRAILVDSDAVSLRAAHRNLDLCGADTGLYDLVRADAVRWLTDRLARGIPSAEEPQPWLVLTDPPYHSGLAQAIMSALCAAPRGTEPSVAVIEHGPDDTLPLPQADRWSAEVRRYGTSQLLLMRPDRDRP